MDTTSPLDLTAAAVGSSTTASSGSAATTSANELICGADTIATGTPGPGAGFTTRIITSPDSDIAEDKIVSTTGSYSATARLAQRLLGDADGNLSNSRDTRSFGYEPEAGGARCWLQRIDCQQSEATD